MLEALQIIILDHTVYGVLSSTAMHLFYNRLKVKGAVKVWIIEMGEVSEFLIPFPSPINSFS